MLLERRVREAWRKSSARRIARNAVLEVLALRPPSPRGVVNLFLHELPAEQLGDFERFLDLLLEAAPIVTLDEGAAREKATAPCFTLSFDDGYLDSLTNAGAVLSRRGIPATIFVASGFVGLSGAALDRYNRENIRWHQTRLPLTRDALERCADAGLTIGSHSVSHPDFSTLEPGQARQELRESKAFLEEAVGRSVTSFAWPFGQTSFFPAACVELARAEGYTHIYSGVSRHKRASLPSGVHPRRQIDLTWGPSICRYFAYRG